MMDKRIIIEVGGPEFIGWWIVINVVVVAAALSIVHGLEMLADWRQNRRRRR